MTHSKPWEQVRSRKQRGYMEILFAYSLVLLCLLVFALFSVLILATDPDKKEVAPPTVHPFLPASQAEAIIVYSVLAAFFLFFLFITLQSREQIKHR
jgi:hypothetical protein